MKLIHAENIPPQPWRNGGGRTRELLALPPGADWTLRVSLAQIDADGPFSAFPGVQRWFVVLQGEGVCLRFGSGLDDLSAGELRLRAGDPPLHFNGALAPDCSLIDGPTEDLNLMLRGLAGTLRPVVAGQPWSERFDARGLFALSAGQLHIDAAGSSDGDDGGAPAHPLQVASRTLVWGLAPGPVRFVPDGPAPGGWWLGASEHPQGRPAPSSLPEGVKETWGGPAFPREAPR